MTLDDLAQLAVHQLPRPAFRPSHIECLRVILKELSTFATRGEIWVDGSFLTNKPSPGDIDIILRMRADEYNDGSGTKRDFIDWLCSADAKTRLHCHVLDLLEYPQTDSRYAKSVEDRNHWLNFFGTYRDNITPKGLAVVTLLDGAPSSWN